MTVAKVWDAATSAWIPVGSGISRAEYSAQDARIGALESAAGGLVVVTNQTVISVGNGNFGPTTVDLSPYLPTSAKVAVLMCQVSGVVTSSGAFKNCVTTFRGDATQPWVAQLGVSIANAAATSVGIVLQQTVLVPLVNRTFQYMKTDAIGSSSGLSGTLSGYLT